MCVCIQVHELPHPVHSVVFTLSTVAPFFYLPQLKVSVKRLRRHFGAPYTFKDRNSGDTKQSVIECLPYDDRSFDLKKAELTTATQVTLGTSLCVAWGLLP